MVAANFPEKYQKIGKDTRPSSLQFCGASGKEKSEAMLAQSHQSMPLFQGPPQAWDGTGDTPLSHRVLDQLQVAIAILDTQGKVLFCNPRARQLAKDSGVVKLGAGQSLRFLDLSADRKFQAGLRRFADLNSIDAECGITIVANLRDACNRPIISTLHLLSEDPRTILATLADSAGTPSEASLQCFGEAYRLTPAERRLARYLASGGCLTDAAKSFSVSCHTVRNQLRSIFDKVGVQRQADLTRLLLAGSACSGVARVNRTASESGLCARQPSAFHSPLK